MARSAEAEVQKLRELEERIKAPCIWGRVPCGIRFEDLQERRYEDAVKLIKKYFLDEEITFRSVKITDDKEGVDEYVHHVRIWLKDKMSVAAVKEKEDKLIGLLILRIQEKHAFSRTFSRVKLTYNEKLSTVTTFYREIEKPVNLFDVLGVRRYMKMYMMCLKPRYRHRDIGKELLKAALNQTMTANVPVLAGIMQTGRLQQIADELGFVKQNEIYYVRYLIDEKIVFHDAGLGNYGAAFMSCRIQEVEEPPEIIKEPQMSTRFSVIEDDDEEKTDG